ncbi:MAG: hypothetical protein ACR2JB_02750 [Bryobacteraceae bacterium]
MMFGAQLSSAQITNPIEAHINHKFTIDNTTLPPGQYTFRILQGSDMSAMGVKSADGNIAHEFLVREADAPSMPNHSESVFNRYGDREILTEIFEQGRRLGVAVVEPSREELRLQQQGQHAIEHTEEQQ